MGRKTRFKDNWRKYALWVAVTLVCAIAVWKLIPQITEVVDGMWGLLGLLAKALLPVGWAVVVAYLLFPFESFLQRTVFSKLGEKAQRSLATLCVTFLIVAVVFSVSYWVIPMLVVSATEAVGRFPGIIEPWIESSRYGDIIGELWRQVQKILDESVSISARSLLVTAGQVAQAVMTTVIAIYILHQRKELLRGLRSISEPWLGEKRYERIRALLQNLHTVFGGYLIGKLLESVAITLLCAAGFYMIGVMYAPLLAIFVGVCSFVPYVGPLIGAAPAVLITFLETPEKLLLVAVVLLVVFLADGFWFGPKLIGGRLGISALGVIVGVTVGGSIAGLWGMVLGIPAVSIIRMAAQALTSWKKERNIRASKAETDEALNISDDIHN